MNDSQSCHRRLRCDSQHFPASLLADSGFAVTEISVYAPFLNAFLRISLVSWLWVVHEHILTLVGANRQRYQMDTCHNTQSKDRRSYTTKTATHLIFLMMYFLLQANQSPSSLLLRNCRDFSWWADNTPLKHVPSHDLSFLTTTACISSKAGTSLLTVLRHHGNSRDS